MRRALRCAAAAAALLAAHGALAPAQDIRAQAESLERTARDAGLPADARLEALDEAIALRRRMAEDSEGTREHPLLAAELAQSVLDRLAWDAADAETLFAYPTESQRRRVRAASEDALRACASARRTIESLLDRARAGGEPLAALVILRDTRLPLLEARARALAEGAIPPEWVEACEGLALDAPALEASRLESLAILRVRSGDARGALESLERREGLAPVTMLSELTRAEALAQVDGRDAARAHLARAMREPPFTIDGAPVALAQLVGGAAQARHAVATALEQRSEELRRLAMIDALAPLASMAADEALRAPALERIARAAAASGIPAHDLPPIGVYALAREGAPIDDLSGAIIDEARFDRLGPLRPQALLEVARRGSPAQRAEAWLRLARDFTHTTEARGAVSAAASAAQLAYEREPSRHAALYLRALDGAASSDNADADIWRYERARVLHDRGAIDDALRALRDVDPASPIGADAAALEVAIHASALDAYASLERRTDAAEALATAAREALELGQPADRIAPIRSELVRALLILDRPEEALSHLEGAPADSPDALAARLLAQTAARRWREGAETLGRSAGAAGEALAIARTQFVAWYLGAMLEREQGADDAADAVASALLAARESSTPTENSEACLALALVRAGRAAEALDIARDAKETRGPMALARAEALAATGAARDALAAYRSVAAPYEGMAAPPPNYWLAWAGIIELLAQKGGDAAAARAQAARLRLIDPELGGAPTRTRIERAIAP